MKRILILSLICLLGIIAADARRNPGQKVGVAFDEMIYDFGTIRQSDPSVKHSFTMTNKGNSPVAILSARASCGCTTPDYGRKPVAPGESTVIKVSFSPKGQKGEMNKEVRVRLKNGDGKSEEITLRLTGVVVP